MTEPRLTAVFLLTLGALLLGSVVLFRATLRIGLPVALLFLAIGMTAGSEGVGGIDFENYALAFRLGTVALVLILFDGGLNTPFAAVRPSLAPSVTLATAGVVGTAAVVAVAARLLGFTWPQAMLVGAVVSSTDAAAVFSVLRGTGLQLRRRVGGTLELESGLNDPVAIILTIELTENLLTPVQWSWRIPVDIVAQLVVGGAIGWVIGRVGRVVLARLRLQAAGLYPVFTVALAALAFGVPTVVGGSGFLAVYTAAVVLGNGELPYRGGILRVHDALAWLSQIGMFLLLGLLAFPSRLIDVAGEGLALALVLAIVARPLVTLLCLAPFRYPLRETTYIGWVGLRGAVPIILATFPVLAAAPGADRIFDVAFFVVVANALIPGGTVRWVTKKLGLNDSEGPPPAAVLDINTVVPLGGELMSFYVDERIAVCGLPLSEIPFPPGGAVMLVVRGHELVPPRGSTVLSSGDHVYVFCRPDDRPTIELMFGRPEEG